MTPVSFYYTGPAWLEQLGTTETIEVQLEDAAVNIDDWQQTERENNVPEALVVEIVSPDKYQGFAHLDPHIARQCIDDQRY